MRPPPKQQQQQAQKHRRYDPQKRKSIDSSARQRSLHYPVQQQTVRAHLQNHDDVKVSHVDKQATFQGMSLCDETVGSSCYDFTSQ